MNFLTHFKSFNEAVNFFEKGKFWSINGKKVRVVGSIPQNPQVLKFQEIDESGNTIGKVFVGKKAEVRDWKQTISKESSKDKLKVGAESSEETKVEVNEPAIVSGETTGELKPEVKNRYRELINSWKEEQKKLGKNISPGEGTRNRLIKQAESEINFDETTDVDSDIVKLKKRPTFDVVDRVSSLVKANKVKDTKNIVKYLDFIKSKMSRGDSVMMSKN